MTRTARLVILVLLGVTLISCQGTGTDQESTTETRVANAVESTLEALSTEPIPTVIHTPTKQPVAPSPTAPPTPTSTPTPIPSATPSPTATAIPHTPTPAATPTEEPTPTQTVETASVGGCGGTVVTYYLWDFEVQSNLTQWNELVDSENLVIEAWNHWVTSTESILYYDQAAGNQGVIEVSDNFLMTAERERSSIAAKSYFGEFSSLATASVALIDSQLNMVQLFRDAAANYDSTAWNAAIDASYTVESRFSDFDREIESACSYWENK